MQILVESGVCSIKANSFFLNYIKILQWNRIELLFNLIILRNNLMVIQNQGTLLLMECIINIL